MTAPNYSELLRASWELVDATAFDPHLQMLADDLHCAIYAKARKSKGLTA